MKRSILLLLLTLLFAISSDAQSEDKLLTDEQIEKRTIQLLTDSSYAALSYTKITTMTTEEMLAYSKESEHSITKVLSAKSKAKGDYHLLHSMLVDERTRLTWEEIDRKLGLK